MRHEVPEPWNTFLREVNEQLDHEVNLHCYGGFVVAMRYGFERPTGDVDFLAVVPSNALRELLSIAGKGSALADPGKKVKHEEGSTGSVAFVSYGQPFPPDFSSMRFSSCDFRPVSVHR